MQKKKKMATNAILAAEMELKLLQTPAAATDGLSERLIEVSLPLFMQNMPGVGMVDRKQGVLIMFGESQWARTVTVAWTSGYQFS